MFSLAPSGTPAAETTAVYALLAVIADPAAARQRLDDLVAQAQKNDDALAAANAAQAKATSDQSAATAALKKANALLTSNQSTADDLAARDAALKAKADALSSREAALIAAQKSSDDAFAKRDAALAADEARAKALLDKASSDADAAQALKDQYESKINALKSALSTAD